MATNSRNPLPKTLKATRAPKQGKGVKKAAGKKKIFLLLAGKYFLMLWAVSMIWLIGLRFFAPPATLLMLQRKNDSLEETGKWKNLRYKAVQVEDVSKQVPLAMIASEDQNFLNHAGFDFKAMQKAFEHNQRGRTVRGGSTISQQVAKNVFLWNGRSYLRKALEAYFTAIIELIWDKERIMEMYLSVAETGNLIFGVEEASRWAFRKSANEVSRSEAATIAAVLPNPRKYSAKNPTAFIIRKRDRIAKHMRLIGGTSLVEFFY